MIEPSELAPIFRQFGLTTYESSVWRALLEKGEADARGLARVAGVPFGRIYDVLNGLEEKGIVEVQNTRPKRFRPRRIAGVVDRLLSAKKVEMDADYGRLEEAAEELKRRFATLDRMMPREEVFVSVALGEQDIEDLVREQMSSAEDEILIAMGQVEIPQRFSHVVSEAGRRLVEATARGVSVRVMFAQPIPFVLKSFGPMPQKAGGRLQVRVYRGALTHFKVIDRRYVILEVVDPYEPEDRIAMVQLLSKKLADHMARVFERCWRNSNTVKVKATPELHIPVSADGKRAPSRQ